MKIICGTGHRPDRLGGYGYDVKLKLVHLAEKELVDVGASLVISGGALGWDQAIACAAFNLELPYHMYLPFKGFDNRWPEKSQKDLAGLCEDAACVIYCSGPGYEARKMVIRNNMMVDASDVVLALWDGSPSGTAKCIKYATQVGVPVVNCWREYKYE